MNRKTTIVVPTIRESCIRTFLQAWSQELADAHILIIEDNPERSFRLKADNISHYSWRDIDERLGSRSWIVPRRTDCVRSFGYYLAALEQPDMIVTLDDDCLPDPASPGYLDQHWDRLHDSADKAWISTVDGIQPRGVPYFETDRHSPVVLNHGLWKQVPDFDAPTQLQHQRRPIEVTPINQTIPRGRFFPMCGMNIAWKPEATPALYFLLMGRDYEFDRFGDIWAGILFKKICDHLGKAVNSGRPAVIHQRASNPFTNLKKEAPGLEVNETFWQAADQVILSGSDFKACYLELADRLPLHGDYWENVRNAMRVWAELFENVILEGHADSETQATPAAVDEKAHAA